MATTLNPSPIPTPPTSNPPSPYPAFPRLANSSPGVTRNASTSSSTSTTTTSSTSSSLVAAPIKPPPIETRTATTSEVQLPSRPASSTASASGLGLGPRTGYEGDMERRGNEAFYGGRGFFRNGPRSGSRQGTRPPSSAIHTPAYLEGLASTPARSASVPLYGSNTHGSPTTPRAPRFTGHGESAYPNSPFNSDSRPGSGSTSGSGPGQLRVTISMDQVDKHMGPYPPGHSTSPLSNRGPSANDYNGSGPALSPTLPVPTSPSRFNSGVGGWGSKRRTLSADRGEGRDMAREKERRQSQVSTHSGSSSGSKTSLKDFILGEELGRGSYSTVVQAVVAPTSSNSPTTNRGNRQYAIKIINQAHLIAEKKVKYATIERDALVRLGTARSSSSPTLATRNGHRRGMSSSSSGAVYPPGQTGKRASNASSVTSTSTAIPLPYNSARRDRDGSSTNLPISESGSAGNTGGITFWGGNRLSIATNSSDSSTVLGSSGPLSSPVMKATRRPSMGAQLPSVVVEGEELEHHPEIPSTPPAEQSRPAIHIVEPTLPTRDDSPEQSVKNDSPTSDHQQTPGPVVGIGINGVEPQRERERERAFTPKARRQSLAPSEKSTKSGRSVYQGHPGIIRLHSTFVDQTSLYFVLDLASNGELLGFIRKFGSLDIVSARYYAAQLIDTIEYMHERGVIHRDLKPENILLDDEMRIKVTDFGSAKLIDKDELDKDKVVKDGRKRSFVGSADFVSPEVLRNEAAVIASDIWAFGCILFQFITGRPPFRAATDYLTFQRILKKEMEFPEGFDEDAKALVELVLNLDPTQRPTPSEIKAHPFFGTTDFAHLWTKAAPPISTGLTKPIQTLATVDPNSDIWAVFDDEGSDGGFEFDDAEERIVSPVNNGANRSNEPCFNGPVAAHAVRTVDGKELRRGSTASSGSLGLPRRGWLDGLGGNGEKKKRGWSNGSAGTSSSSSGNRTALAGLLETIGIGTTNTNGVVSTMASSRSSVARPNDEVREGGSRSGSAMEERGKPSQDVYEQLKLSSLLLTNENIIYTSPVTLKPPNSLIPSFLRGEARVRQLVLTDFPRLMLLKDEGGEGAGQSGSGSWKIKSECVFLARGSGTPGEMGGAGWNSGEGGTHAHSVSNVPNIVMDASEKGTKGFTVQTISQTYTYNTETAEQRSRWVKALKRIIG